jgi:hypothetical protein
MKILFVFLLALIFNSAAAESPLPGNSRPARRIHFSEPVKVNPDEIEIVLSEGAPKAVLFAGEELKSLLEKRTGETIPIASVPTPGRRSLVLGVNQFSRAAGIDPATLCQDSFIIRSTGKLVFILGRDDPLADPDKALSGNRYKQCFERGTLFAVYDFLERFAGIRFYFAGKFGTFIPKGPLFLPAEVDLFDRPDFEIRRLEIHASTWTESPDLLVAPRLDKNNFPGYPGQIHREKSLDGYRLRLQTKLLPNCHGLAYLSLDKRFAHSNPEYFALDKGNMRLTDPKRPHPFPLCFSSEVKEVVFQDAKAYLSGEKAETRGIAEWHPHGQSAGVFDLQPQDSFFYCQCEQCRKRKTAQEISDQVWDFTIELAQRLKQEGVSGHLQAMSYTPYHLLPAREIPDNVLVQIAVSGPWMFGLSDNQDKTVAAWAEKTGGRVLLWNYCGKYGKSLLPGIPHYTPKRVGQYYKNIASKIAGAYMLTSGDYYIFSVINHYMFSRIAWDNFADPEEILKEYYGLMFGPAAQEMEKAFTLIEELWCRANGRIIETELGPTVAQASDYELFEQHYSRENLAKIETCFQRAEELCSKHQEEKERVRFMRWNFIGRLKKAAGDYFQRNNAIRDFSGKGGFCPGETISWETIPKLYLQRVDSRAIANESYFQLATTPESLIIFLHCSEPEMDKTVSSPSDNPSELWRYDGAELFLNASGDRKEYLHCTVNSHGVLNLSRGQMIGRSFKLYPHQAEGVHSEVARGDDFWNWKISIARSSLRNFDGNSLVLNLIRNQCKPDENRRYSWSPFIERSNHDVEKFGTINLFEKNQVNLLVDSNFSEHPEQKELKGISGVPGAWSAAAKIPPGCSVDYDKTTFISGFRSIRLTASGKERWFNISQKVYLKPATRYRVSYFVKIDEIVPRSQESGVCLNIWTDRNRWFPQNKLTGTTPWLKQSFEFETGADEKPDAYIKPFLLSCSGSASFDMICLEELSDKD